MRVTRESVLLPPLFGALFPTATRTPAASRAIRRRATESSLANGMTTVTFRVSRTSEDENSPMRSSMPGLTLWASVEREWKGWNKGVGGVVRDGLERR
jgi:hypothetical protein